MKLVVGLGNPGKEYDNTRHNVGYMFLDYVTNGDKFTLNSRNKAYECEKIINGEKVLFIKPTTFMNLSGEAVTKYINYYHLMQDDILVIQDDLDMELGNYKLLFNHGDGGHNGIKNIILNLQNKEFLRLKIGISKADIDTKEYVLGRFSKDEQKKLEEVFGKFDNFIIDYVSLSRDRLIGKYNTK